MKAANPDGVHGELQQVLVSGCARERMESDGWTKRSSRLTCTFLPVPLNTRWTTALANRYFTIAIVKCLRDVPVRRQARIVTSAQLDRTMVLLSISSLCVMGFMPQTSRSPP